MWKSACVGIHQLLKWKMHGETLKLIMLFKNEMTQGWITFLLTPTSGPNWNTFTYHIFSNQKKKVTA